MVAFAGGLVALVLGILGIIIWFCEFIDLLQGGVPVILILGGILAAYLGYEEIKDKKSTDMVEETPSNLQKEVETLKEEIKGLKEDKEPMND